MPREKAMNLTEVTAQQSRSQNASLTEAAENAEQNTFLK
jgi:hypothetical protein